MCSERTTPGGREAAVQRRLAALRDAEAFHSDSLRVDETKRQMAHAASRLLASPETHLGDLRLLLELASDRDQTVRILSEISHVCFVVIWCLL